MRISNSYKITDEMDVVLCEHGKRQNKVVILFFHRYTMYIGNQRAAQTL